MQSSFKGRPQNVSGYGDQPFNFLDSDAHRVVGHIASIDLIENGDRAARENWQKKQLGNLTNHAYVRSEFWRKRIPASAGRQDILQNFPVLTRKDIALQVQAEGSLFGDKKQRSTETYETTGSTGAPLKVFVAPDVGSTKLPLNNPLAADRVIFNKGGLTVTVLFSFTVMLLVSGSVKSPPERISKGSPGASTGAPLPGAT